MSITNRPGVLLLFMFGKVNQLVIFLSGVTEPTSFSSHLSDALRISRTALWPCRQRCQKDSKLLQHPLWVESSIFIRTLSYLPTTIDQTGCFMIDKSGWSDNDHLGVVIFVSTGLTGHFQVT